MSSIDEGGERATLSRPDQAARKRAAIETFARHELALRRTAQRYSLCTDDADDALQRGLEILLNKAPSDDPRELIRWTQTVVKHEALAVRRERERILSGPAAARREGAGEDWVALIPSPAAGPAERVERSEAIARSREALQALKPQELRALTLLAEGYSYVEIGEITGFSQTKVNRCVAEGRERFRRFLAHGEEGRRCAEMGPLLSTFCDGEAGPDEVAELREHLHACAGCRATLRSYRAAPRAAGALAPALPIARSFSERVHDAFAALSSRLHGAAADTAVSQVAASGGSRGAGVAAMAKVLAICVGTAGGAAACVAGGFVPAPLELGHGQTKSPVIERQIDPGLRAQWSAEQGVDYEPGPAPVAETPSEPPTHEAPAPEPEPVPSPTTAASSGAVEYTPEPASTTVEATNSGGAAESGSAAGEFGP